MAIFSKTAEEISVSFNVTKDIRYNFWRYKFYQAHSRFVAQNSPQYISAIGLFATDFPPHGNFATSLQCDQIIFVRMDDIS